MIYTVECENPLLGEVHIIAENITSIPIIIYNAAITELHQVDQSIFEDNKQFQVIPNDVQTSDWVWETGKGWIKITGKTNQEFFPFSIDFWLKPGPVA